MYITIKKHIPVGYVIFYIGGIYSLRLITQSVNLYRWLTAFYWYKYCSRFKTDKVYDIFTLKSMLCIGETVEKNVPQNPFVFLEVHF